MADLIPEKWMKAMVVTTTVLGVVASIGSSRATNYITKAQFFTAQETDQWAYYQAKSIKQDLFSAQERSIQYKLLSGPSPAQKELLNLAFQKYTQDIARYDQEKIDIKKKVEGIVRQNALAVLKGTQFSLSVVFSQIGVMLSSVGVLFRRREMWYVGIVFGLISIVYIANGFLLLF